MTEETKDPVSITIWLGNANKDFTEEDGLKHITVMPACRNLELGCRALTPEQLDDAVLLWIYRQHGVSIGGPLSEPCHTINGENAHEKRYVPELIQRCEELRGENASQKRTIELLCKTIENISKR